MKEFLNNLLKPFTERVSHPLGKSIFFFWLILNWKSVSVFLFSSNSIENRIRWIEDGQNILWLHVSLHVLLPIFLAIAYVVLMPELFLILEKQIKTAQISRKKEKNELDMAEIINRKEIAKEEKDLQDIISGNKTIEILDSEKQQLSELLDSKNNLVLSLQKSNEELTNKLTELTNKLNQKDNEIRMVEILKDENIKSLKEQNNKMLKDYENTLMEIQWRNEYEEFKNTDLFKYFPQIVNYLKERDFSTIPPSEEKIELFKKHGILSTVYAMNNAKVISYDLTEKGMYFWEKFLNEQQKGKFKFPTNPS